MSKAYKMAKRGYKYVEFMRYKLWRSGIIGIDNPEREASILY